jgi:RNA polymerase sigma-70 factor (ECF subfamily)
LYFVQAFPNGSHVSPQQRAQADAARPERGSRAMKPDRKDGALPTTGQAFLAALHAEHGADLMRYALRHTRDRGFAEDVVQETFARAWTHPSRVQGGRDAARSWLFTVARNLIIDDARSARHRREWSVDEVPERPADNATDAVLDRMLIGDALAGLSPDHRAVVVDTYYLGRSTREVAEHLGIPEGTVKSRLHYGLRALRLALQERGVMR